MIYIKSLNQLILRELLKKSIKLILSVLILLFICRNKHIFNKNQSKMKQIKFLIAIALVSVIAISCKETKKEEVKDAVEKVEDAAKEVKTEVKEEVEVVVDSLKTKVEEGTEDVKEVIKDVKEGAEDVIKDVKEGAEAVKDAIKQ